MDKNKIRDLVYEYKTKHKEGFVNSEIEEILKQFPGLNKEKYNDALMGCTCMVKGGEIVVYHTDVYKGIVCGVENRNLKIDEWD